MSEEAEQLMEDPSRPSLFQKLSLLLHDFASNYLTTDFLQSSFEKLATAQNALLLSLAFLIALISYYLGVNKGSSKAFTVLQLKYLNMEIRRKKTLRSINVANNIYNYCTTLFYLLIFSEICASSYLIYFEQQSLLTFYEIGINGLSLIVGVLLIVFVFIARVFARKISDKNKAKLGEFFHDQEELAKDLMLNLGNDLTNLLKQALLAAQKITEKNELQTLQKDFENRRKELEKLYQQLKSKDNDLNVKSKEIQNLQATLNDVQAKAQLAVGSVSAESATHYQLHESEVSNYKQALRCITTFEWCDGCSKKGSVNIDAAAGSLAREDLKLSDISGSQSPEYISKSPTDNKPKTETVAAQQSESGKEQAGNQIEFMLKKNNQDQEQEDVDESCTNNCIQRYFEMASEVNRKFNEEKERLKKLKKSLKNY